MRQPTMPRMQVYIDVVFKRLTELVQLHVYDRIRTALSDSFL